MEQNIHDVILAILLFPLLGAVIAGIFGKVIGQRASHWVTILGIAVAFVLSVYLFNLIVIQGSPAYNTVIYT